MNKITISIQVEPDIVVVHEKDSGFVKCQYIFSHNFCVVVECERDGSEKKYSYPKYHGARIHDGAIELLDPSHGWRVDGKATKEYIEKIAEKELLK